MITFIKKNPDILLSISLFLVFCPLIGLIDFPQNDDWVYYKMVRGFLNGNLGLDPLSAPTFYIQGGLGMLFSIFFSLRRLPYLTLGVSVLNFLIFTRIIKVFFKKDFTTSILVGLLLFFNPIHVYSILGFMTENYLLFFLLLSLYFLLLYERNKNPVLLFFCLFYWTLSFFVKQSAIVFLGSISMYFLSKRNYKIFIPTSFLLILSAVFYQFVFPLTQEMKEKFLYPNHFTENNYSLSFVYYFLLLLVCFCLPLIFIVVFNKYNVKKVVPLVVVTLLVFLTFTGVFHPETTRLREFPYFGNIFEREGFYPTGISGTKYHFRGMFDLNNTWDITSKVFLLVLFAYLVVNIKKTWNLYSVFVGLYIALMLFTEVFFDRYLLIALPFFILYLLSFKLTFSLAYKGVLACFILFLASMAYQFSYEFVITNKYVWDRSEELVRFGVDPNKIKGTNAWKLSFRNLTKDYDYEFSWDDQNVDEIYSCCFELVDEKKVKFLGSIFVNPKVYLYKKVKPIPIPDPSR